MLDLRDIDEVQAV